MEFEIANFTKYPGWIEAHQALKDTDHVGDLMIAVDKDEKYLASAIAYSPMENNPIARLLPWPRLIGINLIMISLTAGDKVGGVTCIGVSQDISMPGLGLGLLCAAIEQLKLRGVTSCFVDWVI
jgi:beta-N-acetylhexosaminidase